MTRILTHISLGQWGIFAAMVVLVLLWDKLFNGLVLITGQRRRISCALVKKLPLIYAAFILLITLFSREVGSGGNLAWMPLWSWQKVLLDRNLQLLWQILLNVLLFVPLGILLSLNRGRSAKVTVLIGFGLSLCIELCQLVFRLGLFEWDDILHNGIGCALGMLVVRAYQRVLQRLKKQRVKNCERW